MNTPTSFKRVAIGDTFISQHPDTKGQTFRKASQKGAFKIKAGEFAGRGETHKQVAFARSTAVTT